MSPRSRRYGKKVKLYNANMDMFIERLRRVRALNCSPSLFGMDPDATKRFSFNRLGIFTKFL
jgi:hypothetical protein